MYNRPRIIPCLTIQNQGLVKTTKFSNPRYLGDPINAVKIFNGKGVDELCILDITATEEGRGPDFNYLKDLASEAFMPLSYGGGITKLSDIERLIYLGYEKVIINTSFVLNPDLISEAVQYAGSSSVVVSIDVKKELFGKYCCYISDGRTKIKQNPVTLAKMAQEYGAGEILLTSITQDGTMLGYDIDLVKKISDAVSIPVIACGGAKDINDFKSAIDQGGAHAVAASSMFVYYGRRKAVLITVPDELKLYKIGIYT